MITSERLWPYQVPTKSDGTDSVAVDDGGASGEIVMVAGGAELGAEEADANGLAVSVGATVMAAVGVGAIGVAASEVLAAGVPLDDELHAANVIAASTATDATEIRFTRSNL